jgi:MFS family permease
MAPSMLGIQMGSVANGFAAFSLSGSATVLGGVSLAIGMPMLFLSLVGGVVADRAPRRSVLMVTQSVLGLSAAAIAVLAMTGHLAVWQLYVLGFAQGTAFAFNMPARQAYIAEIVPPVHLRSAVTLNNATMNGARILGPSLAGALLAVPAVGIGGVFAVMATMYIAVITALLRLPSSVRRAVGERENAWTQLVNGLRYIRSSPALLGLLVLGFLPLFFGLPFQSLLPVFAERVHGVGAPGLGAMSAAVGAGALAGSLAIVLLSRSPHVGRYQIGLCVGFGLSLIGFALAPTFGVAVALLVGVGFMSAGYSALNQTLVMENTDPQFHGRVMSVYLLTYGMVPFATLPEAWLTDHLGPSTAMLFAGTAVTLSVLLVVAVRASTRRQA